MESLAVPELPDPLDPEVNQVSRESVESQERLAPQAREDHEDHREREAHRENWVQKVVPETQAAQDLRLVRGTLLIRVTKYLEGLFLPDLFSKIRFHWIQA